MDFKIVSTGWRCAKYMATTLASVAEQRDQNWQIAVVYDSSPDNGADIIREWCEEDPEHRMYRFNAGHLYAPRNQYEAIYEILRPEASDVIVFLDLDGDRLAHPDVLNHLAGYYTDDVLLTYGQYRPVPDPGTHIGAIPFPREVIEAGSYREHILRHGPCFNHLRTLRAGVYKAIPLDQFKWANGNWYKGATDYVTMVPALELVNGRYRFIEEVLLEYNHANEFSDNKVTYDERHHGQDATLDVLSRPPLAPLGDPPFEQAPLLPEHRPPKLVPTRQIYGRDAGEAVLYLSAAQRREILQAYGAHYKLNIFIETGTNDGGTPWLLKDQFRELYTIELAPRLWREALARFQDVRHVHCLLGDSTEILPQVLTQINEPALVWLDGHYSGGVTAHGALDTPVKQELEALFADGRNHVILVDDARIFEGGPEHLDEPHYHDYPSIEWVEQIATDNGFDFLLEDDIMRLTPRSHWAPDAA